MKDFIFDKWMGLQGLTFLGISLVSTQLTFFLIQRSNEY